MNDDANGLSTTIQVEALADQLSASADALHARLLREPPGNDVETWFDDEQVLRQRANGLYADAAGAIVRNLGKPQQHVIALTGAAAEQIRKIGLLSDAAGLVAGLLALAGAVASAQPAPVLAALDGIRVQLKAVKAGLHH